MDNNEKIKYIIKLNEKYRANNCNGISSTGINFKIIDGNLPILLSAPHAVRQNRNSQIKGADTLTGPIVEFLCKRTGANGIIRTSNLQDDPNFENVGYGLEYKNAILKLAKEKNIVCMLDIHGCSNNQSFDIDIGTNNGINTHHINSYLSTIYEKLASIGHTTIDHTFTASQDTTICNYISSKADISCFQIELATSLRKDSTNLLRLLDCFEIMINKLSKQIETKRNDTEFEIRI